MRWFSCTSTVFLAARFSLLAGRLNLSPPTKFKAFVHAQVVVQGKVRKVVGYGGMNMHMIECEDCQVYLFGLLCADMLPLHSLSAQP